MHAIICLFDFINFMLFIMKFIKFKPIIKFKKFECHNNGSLYVCTAYHCDYQWCTILHRTVLTE